MFDKSVLTSWSGLGNEATVTVTFVNPIVFHKLVIVKKNGINKAGLSFLQEVQISYYVSIDSQWLTPQG